MECMLSACDFADVVIKLNAVADVCKYSLRSVTSHLHPDWLTLCCCINCLRSDLIIDISQ